MCVGGNGGSGGRKPNPTLFETHNLDRPGEWDQWTFEERKDWYTAHVDQNKWPRGNPFHIDQYLRGEFDRS